MTKKPDVSYAKRADFLEWEQGILSLASKLRTLSQEEKEYSSVRAFIPTSSSGNTTHDQIPSERRHVVFKKSLWEKGLRKIAFELRSLASGIPTGLNEDMNVSNQVFPTILHPQSSAFQSEDTPFPEGLHDIAQILTTHTSRKQDITSHHHKSRTSPLTSVPVTTKSRIGHHEENFRCRFRDILFELESISKKAKQELQAHRKTVQSLERRYKRYTSNEDVSTYCAGVSVLRENRVEIVRHVDGYSHCPEYNDLTSAPTFHRAMKGSIFRRDRREKNFLHRFDGRLDNSLRPPRCIHSIPQASIDQEGEISCWAFVLRAVSQQVFQVALRGRAEGWTFDLLDEDTSKDSMREWAAQKDGQGTLLEWESRLMRLSNEMWEVSKLSRKKFKMAK